MDLAGEGYGHALEHLEVLQLVSEGGRGPQAVGILVVLHVLVRLLHWRALQTELDLTDQTLLEAGYLVLLRERERDMDMVKIKKLKWNHDK